MTQAANLALVGSTVTPDSSGNISISGKKFQAGGITTNAIAWVNFNGSTPPVIRASFNISSITRNSSGDFTLNFTSALSDANYVVLSAAEGASSVGNPPYQRGNYPITSTSNIRLTFFNYNAVSFVDPTYCCVAIFGN